MGLSSCPIKKIGQMIEKIVFKTLGTRQCGRVIHENREINEVNREILIFLLKHFRTLLAKRS